MFNADERLRTPLAVIPDTDESHRHLTARRGPRRGQRVPRLRPLFSISGQLTTVMADATVLSLPAAPNPPDQRQPTTLNTTITTSRNIGLDGWRSVLAAQPSPQSVQQGLRSQALTACPASMTTTSPTEPFRALPRPPRQWI